MNCAAPEAAAASGEQISAVQDIKNTMFNNDGGSKLSSDEAKSTVIELFPWVSEFKKMCKCIYADKSMACLAELMQYYIRNVSVSVNECYTKPLRAAKLKDSISETLLLFLYTYRELSEVNKISQDRNRSIYLNNMSDLLAMYIDMELKASRKSKEDHNRICTRLTSCLYVYLEHSTEHLLDTLIKIQFMCRGYHRILDPIITKVIKNIPAHPESNFMYVRYLLIYCLWRKVNSDMAVKSQITTTAIASLGAPPTTFPPCVLEDVLPKVPKCQPNSAKYLMQQKFDVRKCCELFVQFCRESRRSIWQEKSENTAIIPSSSKRNTSQLLVTTSREDENFGHIETNFNLVPSDKDLQNSSVSSDNLKSTNLTEQTNVKPLGTISTNISVTRTISKPIKPKVLPRKKTKKSNKIVIIDLTTDIAFEKCIKKKRKSKKVVWLEEAKKKFDAKTIKASQKIKKQQITENVNSVKKVTLDQQLEDLLQPAHAAENTCLKNDSGTSIQETKLDSDKVKHLQVEQTNTSVINDNTESEKPSVVMDSSDRNENVDMPCTVSSSVIVDRPQSNKSKVSTNSLLDVSTNDTNNVNKCHHNVNATSEAKTDEKINDRFNIQTVIKRLIEKDTMPESETCKRVESLRKICDLGTEHSKTVNSPLALCAQGDSKDEDDSCNHNANYPSIAKDKLSPHVISSLVHTHHRNNEKDDEKTTDRKTEDISGNERCTQDIRKTMNNGRQSSRRSSGIDDGSDNAEFAVSTTAAETLIVTTVSNAEVLISEAAESEEMRPSRVTAENTKQPKEPESQDKCISARHDVANNTVRLSVMNGDHSNVQTDLEVGICIEVNDDVKDNRSSNHKIRETIFENRAIDKKNISNIVEMSLCSTKKKGVNGDKSIDLKTSQRESAEIDSNDRNSGKELTTTTTAAKDPVRTSVLCTKVGRILGQSHNHKLAKETYGKSSYKISHVKNVRDPSDNRCIIQDSELQDNIDGLSLLASVSQHVSHLKTKRELKCDQIKVKDYASLRSSPCNQSTDDDEADANDLSGTVSRILENPSTEVINRIVGIYPEDALDKVALHVEVTSTTDVNPDDDENDPSNSVSRVVETTINYETDALSNNLSIAESNVQSIKENTNVILNGETVVLLKKSPNSNLYTINKAYDESRLVKEKSWMIPPEDCASFEVVNTSEHISFNLDLPQYKELSCQENKFGRNKGIKIEPEEEGSLMNIAEMKPYGKKGPLPGDVLPATSQIYQDTNVASVSISKSVDKRKSKSILAYRQNIKQEFNSHITPNCGIQGCNGIHSHPHEVIDPQHSLHIPVTHPTTIPSIYGNCAAGTDLCMPYHKHCTSVSCSLQINSTTSLHSHTKSANSCGGRSHCSCLNCTYDIVTHCRQCIHPATDSHVSCIESNSYFLPAHSSVQTSAVQEHDRTKSEAVIGKLYDDQILCKIEQRVLQNNTLEKLDVQREPDKLFKKDMENKLPLKKRLKAMMSMAYEEVPIKAEKLVNYPGIRMMSIAALEAVDGAHKHPSQIIKSTYDLSPNEEDAPHGSYHFNSNVVRGDYFKDMHISNAHHNLMKESTRSHERQFRSAGDQSNAVCLETCQDRTFSTSAQRRDVTVMNPTSMKRITTETMEQDGACKKAKKTQSSIRQTRSSKRNVPKVNYCYTDVDPEWNPSGESKRRRKKTSR